MICKIFVYLTKNIVVFYAFLITLCTKNVKIFTFLLIFMANNIKLNFVFSISVTLYK